MSVNLGSSLRNQEHDLAESIVELQYANQPEVWKPYGHPGREKSVRDARYHLSYLAETLDADAPALFSEYLAWVWVRFGWSGSLKTFC